MPFGGQCTATQHQISDPYAVDLALNTLLVEQEESTSAPEPETTGSSSGGGYGGGGSIDALTLGALLCSLLLALRRTAGPAPVALGGD